MSTFGESCYQARVQRHMTQEELAKAIGKGQALVSSIEKGNTVPSFNTACAIAAVLSISLDALIDRSSRETEVN